MSRNTAAFLIAVLFHLLILILFWVLGFYFAKKVDKKVPQEQRIKVALKELPKAKRNAALENKIPPAEKIPPMPKGSQLEKVTKTKPLPTPKEQIEVTPPEPVVPQQKIPKPKKIAEPSPPEVKSEPLPPEKPYIPFTRAPETKPEKPSVAAQPEVNATLTPQAHKKLFAKLSKKQTADTATASTAASSKREGRIPQDIRDAYGDTFGKLSEGEQKYLLDNQEIMRRLTQTQLGHTGSVMIPNTLRANDENIVEFYLHPDGSMTDFRYIRRSGFFLLDDVTKDTIESVYWKYPRPKQKTLVRYKFGYYLRGY